MTCHFMAAGGTNLSVGSVAEQPDRSRGIKELFLLRDIRKSDLAFSYSEGRPQLTQRQVSAAGYLEHRLKGKGGAGEPEQGGL